MSYNIHNRNRRVISLFVVLVITAWLPACNPTDMPWQKQQITEDVPPHILDETETASSEELSGETTDISGVTEQNNEILEKDSWNKLNSVSVMESKTALANTGNIIERENYVMMPYIEVCANQECFFVCTSVEIHLVYYDEEKQYIDGRASAAIEGEFLELPPDCRYITVSMEQSAVKDSFLVQENEENNVIFVEQGRKYSSVKKAVEQIGNEGIIIIFPGIYKGNVKAWGKNIFFYGTDRDACIMENTSSSYYAPPLEIGAGTVKNLTIRAVGTPSSDTSKAGAYAVHVEDNSLYNSTLTFENCELYSDFNSAVGMGMRGGCQVKFTNVHMTGLENGLFCHDGAYVKYAGVQELRLIDCVIEGMKGENAIRFDSQGTTGSQVNLLFINNILVNKKAKNVDNLLHTQNNGGKGTEENWQGLKYFYLDPNSERNNVDALNYGINR